MTPRRRIALFIAAFVILATAFSSGASPPVGKSSPVTPATPTVQPAFAFWLPVFTWMQAVLGVAPNLPAATTMFKAKENCDPNGGIFPGPDPWGSWQLAIQPPPNGPYGSELPKP